VTAGVRYVGSEEWTVGYEEGWLVVSGGADQLFAVEDVSREVAAEVASLWEEPRAQVSPGAVRVVRQLLSVGALRRDVPAGPPKRIAVVFSPDRDDALLDALTAEARGRMWDIAPSADVTLLVRTGGRLIDVPAMVGIHLFIDVSYHHTVSLGPLVFPGDSACVGCLSGRIGRYWGDPHPPRKPAMRRETRLVAALAALELDKIAAGVYGLANATVALDLQRYDVKRHPLYRLPWCPLCGDGSHEEAVGRIDLPWATAA
jgi:bacteriocin biosynthesis cyclodehydratase domain-containing protein